MNDPLKRRLDLRPELKQYDLKNLNDLKVPPKRLIVEPTEEAMLEPGEETSGA